MLIDIVERGWVPDWAVRRGIRRLLHDRLVSEYDKLGLKLPDRRAAVKGCDGDESQELRMAAGQLALADELARGPMVIHAADANSQHYEVPAEFFQIVLGKQLKYSCGLWLRDDVSLDESEAAMLELTTERAGISDGMDLLELGCGWGSLTLWLAERFPNCRITAVSNSHGQRRYIQARCAERQLTNVNVVTSNIAEFSADSGQFDRVLSVEMFEHVRNHPLLLERVREWLADDGRLFVHIFCHRALTYLFDTEGEENWMGRHFFSGGIMPSQNWLIHQAAGWELEKQWCVDGTHYQRTSEAWLAELDKQRRTVAALFSRDLMPTDVTRQIQRWRMFFMACAELFGYRGGCEWFVSHYLFRKRRSSDRV